MQTIAINSDACNLFVFTGKAVRVETLNRISDEEKYEIIETRVSKYFALMEIQLYMERHLNFLLSQHHTGCAKREKHISESISVTRLAL